MLSRAGDSMAGRHRDDGKWHPFWTVLFIAVTCGGFWALVLWAFSRLRFI